MKNTKIPKKVEKFLKCVWNNRKHFSKMKKIYPEYSLINEYEDEDGFSRMLSDRNYRWNNLFINEKNLIVPKNSYTYKKYINRIKRAFDKNNRDNGLTWSIFDTLDL
ncbi:MAG: hypothetical protein KGO96_06805 [Elusimicrobia bacterium]|nr:hypothetical protein [Elusimicrobiota bacterium]